MSYTPITKSTVFPASWNLIYAVLKAGLTDPSSRGDNDKWLFSSFPDNRGYGSTWKYPIIIIEPVNISFRKIVVDGSKRKEVHKFTFNIYSKSAANIDMISSDLINVLESTCATIRSNGLYSFELVNTDSDIFQIENQKVHNKTLEVEYGRVN